VRFDADVRVALAKRGQQRQHPIVSVRRRHADAQHARRRCLLARCLALRVDELRQRITALFEVAPSGIGQADLPSGPDEQAYAETFFETRDRPADGGRRDARGRRGEREAAEFGCQAEQLDAAEQEVVEFSLHEAAPAVSGACVAGRRSNECA